MDGASEKIIQRVLKINASTKSLVQRLCDVKIYALSVLGYIRSTSVPDKATLKAEAHALHCTTAGPYNAIHTSLFGVGSVCGLGPDLVGIHSISLAARYRTAACSKTLSQGLEKIQAARAYDFAPVLALSYTGTRNFLLPPWLVAPRKLSILYVTWTAVANLMILHRTRNRILPQPCSATSYMGKTLLDQSPCGPPEFLDRSVVFRTMEILPHMKLASRASCPGLTVGFLRILCNGLCAAQRFHTLDWFPHVCALPENRLRRRHVLTIAVHQMIDVEMTFVPTSYHLSYQVSPIVRDIGR